LIDIFICLVVTAVCLFFIKVLLLLLILLIELCQNIVGYSFLSHRLSSRCCFYGNHAAGSEPI